MATTFSLQEEIRKRVQKEDNARWGRTTESIPLPHYEKVRVKRSVGAWNFITNNIFRALLP